MNSSQEVRLGLGDSFTGVLPHFRHVVVAAPADVPPPPPEAGAKGPSMPDTERERDANGFEYTDAERDERGESTFRLEYGVEVVERDS